MIQPADLAALAGKWTTGESALISELFPPGEQPVVIVGAEWKAPTRDYYRAQCFLCKGFCALSERDRPMISNEPKMKTLCATCFFKLQVE